MTRAGVTAVVLSWNDSDRVIALLDRLGTIDPAPDHVVVVDNGSSDAAPARIAGAFPAQEVIRLPTNCGFAAAVNRGIRWRSRVAPRGCGC